MGARVTLICAGSCFGGSSFYPGTWGLGLVGPEDETDEDDFVDTICNVGDGVADRVLVETLVRNIRPGMTWLEKDLGLALKRPATDESAREAAFIPCFDHKHREWRGLERSPLQAAFRRAFTRLGIIVLEQRELLDLVETGERVAGTVLFNRQAQRIQTLRAGSIVLATGGTSALFERRLTAGDVLGSAQGIALAHGARLMNIEFMQMMPGLVAPRRGIIFNEKSFRYARTNPALPLELLELRSTYGPFTTRLASCAVDLAIDAAGPAGMPLRYQFPAQGVPEFVRSFCAWLEQEQGIRPSDELRIALYAHASNGGIAIDTQGGTGVPGLFAAGEATGGMHGADRIGGLSSANGLVFGRRAGRAAAAEALGRQRRHVPAATGRSMNRTANDESAARRTLATEYAKRASALHALDEVAASALLARLRHLMSTHAMVARTAEGLQTARNGVAEIRRELERHPASPDASDAALARAVRFDNQLALADAMLHAMLARSESLGSHHRADAPA